MEKTLLTAVFGDTGSKGGRTSRKSKRGRQGFASMDPEKQRKIASKGGRAAHRKGTAHEWTSDEARAAGRIGGKR
jgi:general stress protein YciG